MTTIEGERVVLREIRRDDVSILHFWLSDPEVARYVSLRGGPQTARETERFVEAQTSGDDPLNRAFIIVLREGNRPVGTTGCYNIDWPNRCGELGIVIGEKMYRGYGYGTEATHLILAFGFQELGLHRLYLHAFDFNERALKSYRKCGLVEEGRLREAHYREGRYHDIVIMSILEDDYRKLSRKPHMNAHERQ
jgi:RimJ/RimL family protein N-acetyltransferase